MTQKRLTELALAMLEAAHWVEATDPGCLDAAMIRGSVDALIRAAQRLYEEGER